MGQVLPEKTFPVEEIRHRSDAPHIPPGDVTILGSGDGRLCHPLVHGRLEVVVGDSGQTCGVVRRGGLENGCGSDPTTCFLQPGRFSLTGVPCNEEVLAVASASHLARRGRRDPVMGAEAGYSG